MELGLTHDVLDFEIIFSIIASTDIAIHLIIVTDGGFSIMVGKSSYDLRLAGRSINFINEVEMDSSQIFIITAIVVLAAIVILFYVLGRNRKRGRFTPLAGLAFGCILVGLFFWENRYIGFGFFTGGIILAVIDILRKPKKE
jgi:hypothetical protein